MTIQFTITRHDFFGLLNDVLPFVGGDETLPMLTAVQIEIAGKRITVRATDRFTFGRAWFELEEEIGEATVMVAAADIRAAAKYHPALKRGLPQKELTITVDPGPELGTNWYTMNASLKTGSLTITSGGVFDAKVTSEHRAFNGEFVSVDKLVPTEFTGVPEIAWNPDLMHKFNQVRRNRRMPIQVRFSGENRPIRIDIGPQFTGCIMPATLEAARKQWAA